MIAPSMARPEILSPANAIEMHGRDARALNSAHQLFFQIADHLPHAGIDFHAVFHEAAGVEHGAVVASAEGLADGAEGAFGHLPREEHRNLAGERDIFRAAL